MTSPTTDPHNRRVFLKNGALVLASGLAGQGCLHPQAALDSQAEPKMRIGLLTDIHHADKPPANNRHYRESAGKLREAVERFNEALPAFVVELGDIIDAAATVEAEIRYLETIEAEFAKFKGERHYVLGNHCVSFLTKAEFFAHCKAKRNFYSFDRGGFHFVVLDACYRADGVDYGRNNFVWTDTDIPPVQRDWLREDLRRTNLPTVIFAHQRLDVENNHGVKSAPLIREILRQSGVVAGVFQGHSHQNAHTQIDGIHYTTLRAVVEGTGSENSGYGLLSLFRDGSMRLEGFRQQSNWDFAQA